MPQKTNKKRGCLIALIVVFAIIVAAVIAFFILLQGSGEDTRKVVDISIVTLPKTEYEVNDSLDIAGLQLLVTYEDGESAIMDGSRCSFTGFDSRVATEAQTITVSYREFAVQYTISVKAKVLFAPKLVSIAFKTLPQKLSFPLKGWYDPAGGVLLCTYEDGSTQEIALDYKHITGFDNKSLGKKTLTVTVYDENYMGVFAQTTYDITITE